MILGHFHHSAKNPGDSPGIIHKCQTTTKVTGLFFIRATNVTMSQCDNVRSNDVVLLFCTCTTYRCKLWCDLSLRHHFLVLNILQYNLHVNSKYIHQQKLENKYALWTFICLLAIRHHCHLIPPIILYRYFVWCTGETKKNKYIVGLRTFSPKCRVSKY